MSAFYHAFFYQPILDALVWVYHNIAFQDFGLAVIILTIAVRVVLFPLFYKGAKQQALIQKIHPELMGLYKKHGINPFASFLVLIIQLPIVIGLYQVILKEITSGFFDNFLFLSFIDVKEESLVLAIIAAALQYVQAKMAMPKEEKGKASPAAGIGKTMLYVVPGITFLILTKFPAALGLYWVTTTLFSIGQQAYIMKTLKKKEEKEAEKEVKQELKEIHGTNPGKN